MAKIYLKKVKRPGLACRSDKGELCYFLEKEKCCNYPCGEFNSRMIVYIQVLAPEKKK